MQPHLYKSHIPSPQFVYSENVPTKCKLWSFLWSSWLFLRLPHASTTAGALSFFFPSCLKYLKRFLPCDQYFRRTTNNHEPNVCIFCWLNFTNIRQTMCKYSRKNSFFLVFQSSTSKSLSHIFPSHSVRQGCLDGVCSCYFANKGFLEKLY